jgi:hypothetical protein
MMVKQFLADPAPRLRFHTFLYVFYNFAFFLGSVFSPVVRASLVGLLADAPGCRGLGALGGSGRLGWLPATLNR